MGLAELRAEYPYPDVKPAGVAPKDHGWFRGQKAFKKFTGPGVKVYLEIGAWLGKSAMWFANQCPNATIVCVDHWKGSEEHHNKSEWKKMLPSLYETFLVNTWKLRDRFIPVRCGSVAGMQKVKDFDVNPDIVYVDASHDTQSVYEDLSTALTLFPNSQIIGDDWQHKPVRAGVEKVLIERGLLGDLAVHSKVVWSLEHRNR